MEEKTIDREAMGKLANALAFIRGADHPATIALRAAAESGAQRLTAGAGHKGLKRRMQMVECIIKFFQLP